MAACAKLRQAMRNPGRSNPLRGLVEVDKTEILSRSKDDPITAGSRSAQGELLAAGAIEIRDGGPAGVRLAAIRDFSAASLHGFIGVSIEKGATIKSDGWASCPGAPDVAHEPHVAGNMAAHVAPPWIHRVFSNLKTGGLGAYHGMRQPHLQSCLDEFTFRFYRRRSRHAAFSQLLSIALASKPLTHRMLIQPEPTA